MAKISANIPKPGTIRYSTTNYSPAGFVVRVYGALLLIAVLATLLYRFA